MFKIKNKITYFGVEFDHNKVPNALVIASARPQKIIKWVNSYKPSVRPLEDGTEVRRERTAVQCPIGFRLRKDEIQNAMKRNKSTSWQDGKFFVILDHRIGNYEHPDTVKMKKSELQRKVADEKRNAELQKVSGDKDAELPATPAASEECKGDTPSDPPKPVGVAASDEPSVAVCDGASKDNGPVESVTEGGIAVTDRRRGAGDKEGEKQGV